MEQQSQSRKSRTNIILWVFALLRRHSASYIIILVAALLSAYAYHELAPNYFVGATIYLNSEEDSQLIQRLGKISGFNSNPYAQKDNADKYVKLLNSQSFVEYIAEQMQKREANSKDKQYGPKYLNSARNLLGQVSVKKRDYDRVDIVAESSSRPQSVFAANSIAQYGREAIIKLELKELAESESYLKKEMADSRQRLNDISNSIEDFRKKKNNSSFSLTDKASPIRSSIAKLRGELEITQVKITRNNLLIEQFEQQISSLHKRGIAGLDTSEANILNSRGRLADMIQAVREESKNLVAGKQALEMRLDILEKSLSPDVEQKIFDFQKQLDLEYSFYELLQKNLFQSGIQSISAKNRVRSVDLASEENVQEKLPLFYKLVFSILLATLATIALIAIQEYFFPVIISKQDILDLGITYISYIPNLKNEVRFSMKKWKGKSKENIVRLVDQRSESQGGIAFRYLRVRFLQLMNKFRTEPKVFAMGSSRADEGKSFVAANFAVSLSMVGRKVLLIDGDLRKASITKLFSDLVGDGIIQFCRGESRLEEVIQRDVVPNLDFIPVGYFEENETFEVFTQGKLKNLIDMMRPHYDNIIVDTPAFFAGPDALQLYEMADAPVLVLQANQTPSADTHNIVEMLKGAGHERIFAVLNRYNDFFESRTQNYYYVVRPENGQREAS